MRIEGILNIAIAIVMFYNIALNMKYGASKTVIAVSLVIAIEFFIVGINLII